MKRVYLDYNASTPIAPELVEAMTPFFTDYYGNPSTTHWAGKPAKEAYEKARQQIAALLECDASEVIFTSGGSESNNHALKGVFYVLQGKGNHIITTQIEHPAIINPCEFLRRQGARITYVGVDSYGRVTPADIEKAITDKTILISVMHANNEVGVIQPIAEISRIARKHNIIFHSDAAQSAGKIPTKVNELGVDLLSIAGHKLYAPKGIGALYIRRGTPIEPLIHGAGHEGGRRAGTENILLALALGEACKLAVSSINDMNVEKLRDYFWQGLKSHFKEKVVLNGHPDVRLPNTLNVSFVGRSGQDLLSAIPQLAASTGSACHAGTIELSPVLKAMRVDEYVGMGTIRFSLGRYTTKEELDLALQWLIELDTPVA
jgi:cysteine desulfurase